MLSTPLWGKLVDAGWVQPEFISPLGHLLIACSLLLIGPIQYVHMRPSYELTEAGLALMGVGTAATLTATFALTQKYALLVAPEMDDDDSSIVSGLWTSAFALGNFVGPTVGGPLVYWLGFSSTTPILQAWALVMLLLDCGAIYISSSTLFHTRRSRGDKPGLYVRLE